LVRVGLLYQIAAVSQGNSTKLTDCVFDIAIDLNKIGLLYHIADIGPIGQKPNFTFCTEYFIV